MDRFRQHQSIRQKPFTTSCVQDREDWFQTPCGAQLTPDFIASVQRALQARGHFSGPVTSKMDKRTRVAVRRYQQSKGVNSEVLALSTARELGLIAADGNPFAN